MSQQRGEAVAAVPWAIPQHPTARVAARAVVGATSLSPERPMGWGMLGRSGGANLEQLCLFF